MAFAEPTNCDRQVVPVFNGKLSRGVPAKRGEMCTSCCAPVPAACSVAGIR